MTLKEEILSYAGILLEDFFLKESQAIADDILKRMKENPKERYIDVKDIFEKHVKGKLSTFGYQIKAVRNKFDNNYVSADTLEHDSKFKVIYVTLHGKQSDESSNSVRTIAQHEVTHALDILRRKEKFKLGDQLNANGEKYYDKNKSIMSYIISDKEMNARLKFLEDFAKKNKVNYRVNTLKQLLKLMRYSDDSYFENIYAVFDKSDLKKTFIKKLSGKLNRVNLLPYYRKALENDPIDKNAKSKIFGDPKDEPEQDY